MSFAHEVKVEILENGIESECCKLAFLSSVIHSCGELTKSGNEFFLELNESAQIPTVFLPAVSGYLAFSIGMLKVFGIAFQLPLVLVGLNRIGLLSKESVVKSRRYVIIGIFIFAAMLTPPDVVSQILLALPMLLLFEISILFMRKDNA